MAPGGGRAAPAGDSRPTGNRRQRKESERFKSFTYDGLLKRDKVNLDIFWLKDEALEEAANLPAPEILALGRGPGVGIRPLEALAAHLVGVRAAVADELEVLSQLRCTRSRANVFGMNASTLWIRYWNQKVKRFGIFEIKMAQGAAMGLALIVAKLYPQVLTLSVWWFVAWVVVCAVPVHYALWFKKNGLGSPATNG